jgi:hypothetical protein
LTGTTTITGLTSGNALTVNNSTSTGSIFVAQDNGLQVFGIANGGAVTFQNQTDSTTGLRVLDADGGTAILTIDTVDERVAIGGTPANGLLTIGTNTTAASGGLYFGTDSNIYRSAANALRTGSALTVDGLLTGSLGATISGATTSINASSNFATNINTGTSTGAISIGNSLAGAIALQSASTVGLTGTTTVTGLTTGTALTVNNSTSTGSIFVAQDNGVTVLSVADGGNLLFGSAGDTNLFRTAADTLRTNDSLTVDGSVVLGDASTDTVTFNGQINSNVSFSEAADRTLNVAARASNAAGRSLTIAAGAAGSGASPFTGGTLILQGGAAAGTGSAAGGNITLTGGAGTGSGTSGLVVISNPTYSAATVQNFTSSGSITAANVNSFGTILITSNAAGYTATLGDPAITTAGRVVYVTNSGSFDMTLSVNGGGSGNTVTLKPNTTATMIWNGADWTAAGASSSTDLQAAYNNTATSAGGAELILNASGGAADGLTIRNNATTPITGAILEVQSSIGNNLFSVNNFGSEFAANGGAEDSSTFSTNWTLVGGASAPVRTTTAGQFATGQAAVSVGTSGANSGVRNNLATSLATSTTYQVSFSAKLASGSFSALDVQYSRDGGTDLEACTNYSTQTLSTSRWTKITCDITTDGTSPSNADLIIRQTDATARTIYIDNVSIRLNSSSATPPNVQIGGGINGGAVTLLTLDQASAPPVGAGDSTYYGSMYYDTVTGRIQCYEADGWGACGSPPNNIITLTPEYAGAVLNGTGVGTMQADFCSNQVGILEINATLCDSGEAVNFYEWTSPQASFQTYSIYLTFQLPDTFESFTDDNTITLDARTTDTTDASVNYELFRSTGSSITECGSDTTVTTANDTWQTVSHNGNENSGCSFVGGDRVIFKLNMTARNNDSAYVSDINFTYTNE